MRVIALLALCFAAVAAVPKNPQRIVGGSVTTIDQYPSMASLLLSWAGEAFAQVCGGTIINNRSLLTAAHCVFESHPSQWKIRVGSTYANSGGVVHNLHSILIHPDLSQTLDNDIAMIRIATSFSFNNNVQPASIAGPNYNLADNTVVWASGWGATADNGTQSEELRHVQIWTINQNICTERYATLYLPISENMLCSGWLDVGGRDQCQGDSGGPLYHNGVLVGVCSFGWGCGDPYYPGINVRVSRYTSWIQSNA